MRLIQVCYRGYGSRTDKRETGAYEPPYEDLLVSPRANLSLTDREREARGNPPLRLSACPTTQPSRSVFAVRRECSWNSKQEPRPTMGDWMRRISARKARERARTRARNVQRGFSRPLACVLHATGRGMFTFTLSRLEASLRLISARSISPLQPCAPCSVSEHGTISAECFDVGCSAA